MKTIIQSYDTDLIKGILGRENIYDMLAYDGSPNLEHYVLKGIWFLLVEDEMYAGAINLEQMNNVLWTPHIFIFRQYRGNGSEEWGKQVAEFMRTHCGAKRFLAFTPYESARIYAQKVGFTYIGCLKNSIQKNGQLLDQYMLELGEEQ